MEFLYRVRFTLRQVVCILNKVRSQMKAPLAPSTFPVLAGKFPIQNLHWEVHSQIIYLKPETNLSFVDSLKNES